MNQGPLLFLGILLTLVTSFWGLVLAPDMRMGRQQQITNNITGVLYPAARAGLAQRGAEVYRSLGCVECHSQQVRGVGSDLARGWGGRMTVAQDYLGEYPVFLGNQRIGPDLANIGMRKTTAPELLRHLRNPQELVAGSMMPPYPFLFEKVKLRPGQRPEASALGIANGCQVVPTADAEALVAYLLSLRSDSPLFEAPTLKGTTAGSTGGTNTTGTVSTNSSGTNLPVPSTTLSTNAAGTNTGPETSTTRSSKP